MDLQLLFNSSSSSSSSSDDEENLFLNVILPEIVLKKHKNEKYVENIVSKYTDEEFVEQFRIPRKIVEDLQVEFEASEFYSRHETGYPRISPEKCLLVFLWFVGHEAPSYRDIADRFNVSLSTLHGIIIKVSIFLSGMASQLITWPVGEEKQTITEAFQVMGFPGAMGCIDGTHIRIDKPTTDSESYLNRKKYYSIQMQAICDHNRVFRDVFIGYPGSVHDARVFRNSPVSENLPDKCGENFILGDSAYPCLRYLLTPYRDSGNLNNLETNFNKKLSHCRILIEHSFGVLKQKFRVLYHMKMRNVEEICHVIRACCVLHNLCIKGQIDMENVGGEENEDDFNEVMGDDEYDGNEAGQGYRNYVASILTI